MKAVTPLAWIMAGFASVVYYGLVDLGSIFELSDPAYLWAVPLGGELGRPVNLRDRGFIRVNSPNARPILAGRC